MIIWIDAQRSPRLARWIEYTFKVECHHVRDLALREAEDPEIFTAGDFVLRLALKRVGIAYQDIKAIMVGGAPGRFAALKTGNVDFTVVTESGKIDAETSGFKVVIDMAKLNVPFQFACTATTGKIIRQNPDRVRRMVRSLAGAVHYFKTHKDESIKIMQRYTLGQSRAVLEGSYSAYRDLLVEDLYPTMEGIRNTLEVQASFDATKAKAEDFVDLRFCR